MCDQCLILGTPWLPGLHGGRPRPRAKRVTPRPRAKPVTPPAQAAPGRAKRRT